MSDDIYHNVLKTEVQGMDRERVEMTVEIYESGDDYRKPTDSNTNTPQPLQSTGSECVRNRSYRAATVCLVLLCVLLLTAVIVLCVLTNTNNHQLHNLTEERDQLLTNNTNLTEEREQLIEEIKRRQKNLNESDGWIYYNFSLYFISLRKKNWSESRRYCRERGADLLIINNREEQDFVSRYVNDFWIGLSDSDEEGSWKWVDNSTLNFGERFWASNEPNGQTRENCVVCYKSGWTDDPCDKTYKWICERNIFKGVK